MDALDRIAPVARDLVARVDALLVRHGAPPDHPVWAELRRLGTVPGDAVEFFARVDVMELRTSAARLRAQAEHFAAAAIPPEVHWHSTAGESYSAHAAALAAHLDGMIARLTAMAEYADAVADWFGRARNTMAMALADVLAASEAIVLRPGQDPESAVPAGTLRAAADIGAHLLAAAAQARADGHDLLYDWRGRLDALPYQAPVLSTPYRFDTTIELS
jgi:hypothetical protein